MKTAPDQYVPVELPADVVLGSFLSPTGHDRADDGEYVLIGLLSGTPRESVATCGESVWEESNWAVVKVPALDEGRCASDGWPHTRQPRERTNRR